MSRQALTGARPGPAFSLIGVGFPQHPRNSDADHGQDRRHAQVRQAQAGAGMIKLGMIKLIINILNDGGSRLCWS
jgi:hypothetical protein